MSSVHFTGWENQAQTDLAASLKWRQGQKRRSEYWKDLWGGGLLLRGLTELDDARGKVHSGWIIKMKAQQCAVHLVCSPASGLAEKPQLLVWQAWIETGRPVSEVILLTSP